MANVPQIIRNLVETFEKNIHEYKNPKYNETHIRVEFVNPFWKALGWDVTNEAGYVMAFRDVIQEDEIKIGVNWNRFFYRSNKVLKISYEVKETYFL
jgi:hypothetical protein